jgi:hypothetical protein
MRGLSVRSAVLRDRIQGMDPSEAVEVLLHVIDEIAGAGDGLPEELAHFRDVLTPKELAALMAIYRSPHHLAHLDRIYAALYGDMVEGPHLAAVRTMVQRVRAKLPRHMEIRTVFGFGYQFEVTP